MRRAIGVLILLISVGSAISSGQPPPPPVSEVHDLEVTADPSAIPADGEHQRSSRLSQHSISFIYDML